MMTLFKTIGILVSSLLILQAGFTQELNCTVRVSTPKLQTADPRVFESLESTIREFLNNQKWSDHSFKQEERIECNIQLNITEELSENLFKADVAIQALRPVYGSDYKTATITHVDKDIVFEYEQFQQIEDSRDAYRDNISSVLTYYAYLILGFDFDSYSVLGGEPYFRIAQNIINTIPPGTQSQDNGWSSLNNNKNNRFWIIENMLNPRIRPFREAMYTYHRQSLDVMNSNTTLGIEAMVSAIEEIGKVNNSYPSSIAVRMFTNAKSDETIEIIKNAERSQKTKVYNIMRRADPANAGKYSVIRS
jgi:hypothetical protein